MQFTSLVAGESDLNLSINYGQSWTTRSFYLSYYILAYHITLYHIISHQYENVRKKLRLSEACNLQ